MDEPAPRPRALARVRKRWRAWLRPLHRDVGYLVVGLTFVYAISGVALNHIEDWNPNFRTVETVHDLGALPDDDQAATAAVARALGIEEPPEEAYPTGERELSIYYPDRTIEVDRASGRVVDTRQERRLFIRVANWLHYNRQKGAWTKVADTYAALLLFLAVSGAFMLKGRKGLHGRGAVLIAAGVAVPLVYVYLSGGPAG